MTVPLDEINDIREMDAAGVPRAEIARRLRLSRNTVAKYADMADMSPAAPETRTRRRRALSPEDAAWIDAVLEADSGAPRKRRHSARRIHDRLVAERGYEGSHSTVQRRAPAALVPGNATEAGRMPRGEVTESRLFSLFRARYRCASRYRDPYSGNEKGSVENAVGFIRRNLLVPVPSVGALEELNGMLEAGCARLNAASRCRDGRPVADALAEDLAAMSALPPDPFDAVRWVRARRQARLRDGRRPRVRGRAGLALPQAVESTPIPLTLH